MGFVLFFLFSVVVVNSVLDTSCHHRIMSTPEELADQLVEQEKWMPEVDKAEESDFEYWGKAFCELMVCIALLYVWIF